MSFSEYESFDGLGLAELVAQREVTAAELVEEAIQRIEKHNPTINAVIYPMYDLARELARQQPPPGQGGSFQGVPFLLKDILGDHEGVPTTFGSRFMQGAAAEQDSELVVRYKRAGLVALGKTNVPELGTMPTTESQLYGPARNPWNTNHSTGGSSGGSAAAVAAGIVPLAHANDGGGSIRVPAACCGLVGLKPTRGRNPLGPLLGDSLNGLGCEHVVSRTVRDSAAALDSTAGPDVGDPYWAPPPQRPYLEEVSRDPARLRIACWTRDLRGNPIHPECVRAVEEVARLCSDLGHEVQERKPEFDLDEYESAFLDIWAVGNAAAIDGAARALGREPSPEFFEPLSWGLYEQGKGIPGSQFQLAIGTLQLLSRKIARFFEEVDAWLTPVLASPPVKLGYFDTNEGDFEKAFAPMLEYLPFTPLANATGQPSISLPLAWSSDGLPIGALFTARFGDEGLLYRIAGQLERARPWIDRKPAIWG
jgi:amidase